MRKIRFFAVVLAMLLVLCQAAFAEQQYVNLEERFDGQETYEYGEETYYLKNRVSTTLVLCANLSGEEQAAPKSAELIVLLPIDDGSKSISPIQLDVNMVASWLEGEDQANTLGQLFAEAESADAACVRLMEVLNGLFPTDVIGNYALLDLRGLPVLDGVENDENNVTGEALIDRLKAIKNQVEHNSATDINAMISDLSDYIITDMKSGAMMKVVDKVDRYDREARALFPVQETEPESVEPLVPELAVFEEMMIDIYYDESGIW